MSTYLPPELQQDLRAAQSQQRQSKARFRLVWDGTDHKVTRLWETGFALDAQEAPKLRGHIDIYEGPRLILRGLIVAAEQVGDEVFFEYKRVSNRHDAPPADFVATRDGPAGLLTAQG